MQNVPFGEPSAQANNCSARPRSSIEGPGKQTIAEYIAFKEPHDRINEEAEDIPDEVLKEQLVIDLKGEENDALKQYLQGQLER